jgi:hypothetical protein
MARTFRYWRAGRYHIGAANTGKDGAWAAAIHVFSSGNFSS